MDAKQIDIWGNEISLKELEEKDVKNCSGKRYKTMQEIYGTIEGKQCKSCKNLMKVDYHNKTYYKCSEWILSHSKATDIRLRDTACGKYEEVELIV